MRWMIASDIHGSEYYCEVLMKAYEDENADRMLLLGDILYHGPRNPLPKGYNPKGVTELLNAAKQEILCVRGNCDSDVDQMVLQFPILADYCVISEENMIIYATHGHLYNEKNLPSLKEGDVLLNGHTHIPEYIEHENYIYINPGSVSLPKENSWHGYIILENGIFTWKNTDGDVMMRKRIYEKEN